MTRTLQAAAVQMDVQPAPTDVRLFRAEELVFEAAQLGADLVALPELFNTGYSYTPANFTHAETMDGPTVTWMKHTAHRNQVHLAGSLLLRDDGEIFNALLLVAPDGRTWRYDKSYPWGYERGYYRPNREQGAARAVVAQTSLGNLGLLVCWDVAHAELWQHYAGQVDLIVACSCPPEITNPMLHLPDGCTLGADQLGPLMRQMRDDANQTFVRMVAEQAAWLGVPVIHAAACGTFRSPLPGGSASLLAFAAGSPSLLRYLPQADRVEISSKMVEACQILSAEGKSLTSMAQSSGEGLITHQVNLTEPGHMPSSPQPPARASRLSYLLSDGYLPRIMLPVYRRGLRQTSAA